MAANHKYLLRIIPASCVHKLSGAALETGDC